MCPEAADAALWKEYAETRSEGCRERIVKRYLPLIKYVVGRMVVTPPSGLDYEDLLSFGIFGLLDAIERGENDPRTNQPFAQGVRGLLVGI